jgi:CHAT domain-containing protein
MHHSVAAADGPAAHLPRRSSCATFGSQSAGRPPTRRALLTVTGLLLVGSVSGCGLGTDSLLDQVQRAQPERVFVPRLSIDTEYRRCDVETALTDSIVTRCAEAGNTDLPLDTLVAAGESLDPDSLRASALGAMFWAHERAPMDVAIERLSTVLEITDDPLPVLVDLSAAHLVRAEQPTHQRDLPQSLEYALRALELDSANLPALFNAALATEATHLRERAEAAWNAYLAADSTSEWADEARRRRDALGKASAKVVEPSAASPAEEVAAFARNHAQRARELGWETVLRDWGKAVLESDTVRADAMLRFAERLGTALKAQGRDPSLMDAVRAIRAAASDTAATRRLARGHHAYGVGRDLFETDQKSAAADSFDVVLRIDPPSPALIGWARVERMATNAGATAAELHSFVSTTDSVRNPALVARARWVLGRRLERTDSTRLPNFSKAAATFHRLGEWESYGGSGLMEAWPVYEQGDTLQGYAMLLQVLKAVSPYRESVRLHNALTELAFRAEGDGMPRAALRMLQEDEKVAPRVRNPSGRAESLLARARLRAVMDSLPQARKDLEAAAPLVRDTKDSMVAEPLRETLRLSRFIVSPPRDPDSAAAALDSVMAYFAETNLAWPLIMLVRRVEVRLDTGDLDGAATDLDSLTASIRSVPRDSKNFHSRVVVLERMRYHYDRLVMAYVRAGKPLKALQVLDRSRTSFQSDSSRRTATHAWTPPPPGKVVLQYALIGDTLLTWVVRRDSITLRERRLAPGELPRTIARTDAALQKPSRAGDSAPGLRRLYDVLIRPVLDRIPPGEGTELVVVADGEIAGVPFAALLTDPRRAHYLVEQHPIRYAVSLADAARVTRVDSAATSGRVLLVANPTFDRLANVGLEPLQGANAEVDSLRGEYPEHHMLLRDTSATIAAFQRHAAGARMVHYAGHALFDNTRPERSFLLLAGRGASGQLTADSVGTMKLDGVRLVVLSACRTLRGRPGRSGGFAGLSGALLDAGVDGVVGSLWLVDDERAQPLMLEFHRAYRKNPDPARALRDAQLRMIRDPELRSPALWAGFRYMGR